MKRALSWLCLFFLGTGVAYAHADYKSSDPAKGAILEVAPSQVTLYFTESLETRFSIFKVYRLDSPIGSAEAQAATAPSGAEDHAHDASQEHDESDHHDVTEGEAEATYDGPTIEQLELLRLNGLAGSLVTEVLGERGDEEVRADAGLVTEDPRTDAVIVNLKPDLAPGVYVVMWRVLGTDAHTTQGYYVFQVAPPGP